MVALEAANKKIKELKLYIDDEPGQHIRVIQNKARKLKRLYDIKLLAVDYLQLAHGDSDNRDREIGEVSAGLKLIAKELDIPVIALSQLNRQVENRTGRTPNLSDLRESGAIEADADIVMFIHRPERYKIETFEDGSSTKGIAQVIIEKDRNGAVGEIGMRFIDYLTLFEDIESTEINTPMHTQASLFKEPGSTDDLPF